VNRSGLEYGDLGITAPEIAEIVSGWQARIIRLPFNQDFVLNGRSAQGLTADAYLAAIDQVIAWAAALGAYTLLDLQWLDGDRVFGTNGDMSFNRVPALPEPRTIDLWRLLATRYRDEPAVLFDLFNEPHSPLPDDSNELFILAPTPDGGSVPTQTGTRRVGMREWQPWAHRLIAEIRAIHPLAVIFVAGISWAYDLRGLPLIDANGMLLENVVYTTHVYPWSRTRALGLGSWETEWDRAFGHLASRVPVFAGEWGGTADDVDWGERLVRYFVAHAIGWSAWSWADSPRLVASAQNHDYTPTPFGEIVKEALLPALT
jgi:endoglucanase